MRALSLAMLLFSCAEPRPVPVDVPLQPPTPKPEALSEAAAPPPFDAGLDALVEAPFDAGPVATIDAGPDPRAGCPPTVYRCKEGKIPEWIGRRAEDVLRCQGESGKKRGNTIVYFNYCSMDCDRASTITFVIANGKVASASGVIKYTGAFCHPD